MHISILTNSFVEKPTFTSFGYWNLVDILVEKVFRFYLISFLLFGHTCVFDVFIAHYRNALLKKKIKLKNSRMSSSLWKYTRHTCLEAVKQAIKYRRPFCRNLYIFSALLLILAIRTKCRNEGTGPRPLKLAPLLPICHDIEARVCERGAKVADWPSITKAPGKKGQLRPSSQTFLLRPRAIVSSTGERIQSSLVSSTWCVNKERIKCVFSSVGGHCPIRTSRPASFSSK